MPKKSFDLKKWLLIGGIPTVVLAIVSVSRTITTYADMPKRQEAVEKTQKDMGEVLTRQQTLLEYVIGQDKKEKEVICSPDKKSVLDKDTGKWRKKDKEEECP